MKKILIQFAAFFLVIACIFILAGKTDGWIEPPEEEATGDIILSGTKYNGKVVVNITLHPDGTGEHEGNGDKTPATWEAGSGDVAMVVHFNVKDTDYDMNVTDTGTGYSAMYPLVADMELTGSKPVRDITLSGTKYNGKVVINITLHPDGTGEHEGNGDKTPATWEAGSGDAAMVVHFNVKGTDYDMSVVDNGTQYVADYPLVADMQLTGSRGGAAAVSSGEAAAETGDAAPEAKTAPEAESVPAEQSAAAGEEAGYPADTFLLEYVADINEQLTGSFSCPAERWKPALGDTGSYTPAESDDLLFSWDATGKSKKMNFYANGTFEFQFTTMSISEKGTWTYSDGKLSVTTGAGKEYAAGLAAGDAEPEAKTAPEAENAPAEQSAAAGEEAGYPADTFLLEYVADINEQLTGSFSCPAERWKPALGDTGSYTPAESDDLLFSWDATGKSKKMDFYANGTFEFQFTTMSISEKGTWTYSDGKLSVTTGAGKEYAAGLAE